MANSIALIQKYLDRLDLIYKQVAKSSGLEASSDLVQETMDANVVKIAKIAMQGMGDYSRANGYTNGDVTLDWETHTFTNDRGRSFTVDRMDNVETAGKSFGVLASEFIRTKVVPEVDAYRFAKIAGTSGIQAATPTTLTSSTVKSAINTALTALEEKEVDGASVVIYMTPTVKTMLEDALTRQLESGVNAYDQQVSYYNGVEIITVPQNRFYTAITLQDGSTSGEENGGYIKNASTGKDINFIAMDRNAVFGITKNRVNKVISPELNQTSDGWKFFFRLYHDMFVLENKKDGIYLHNKA